jgi:hypothetical protein
MENGCQWVDKDRVVVEGRGWRVEGGGGGVEGGLQRHGF